MLFFGAQVVLARRRDLAILNSTDVPLEIDDIREATSLHVAVCRAAKTEIVLLSPTGLVVSTAMPRLSEVRNLVPGVTLAFEDSIQDLVTLGLHIVIWMSLGCACEWGSRLDGECVRADVRRSRRHREHTFKGRPPIPGTLSSTAINKVDVKGGKASVIDQAKRSTNRTVFVRSPKTGKHMWDK